MYYNIESSGKKIKALRKSAGLSQVELADKIGIHVKTISKVERGICGMSVDYLILISEFFQVTIDYIVKNNGEKTNNNEDLLAGLTSDKKIQIENIIKEIIRIC